MAGAGAILQGSEGRKFVDPLLFRAGTTIKEERKVDLYRRCAQLQAMSEKLENLEGILKGNFPLEVGKTMDQQLKDIFRRMPIANNDYKYMMSRVKDIVEQLSSEATTRIVLSLVQTLLLMTTAATM